MNSPLANTNPETSRQGSMLPFLVVGSLYRLLQAVRIHQNNNQLVLTGAMGFSRDVAPVLAEAGEVTIQMQRGQLFFQGNKVISTADTAHLIHNLQLLFEKLGLGGIRLLKDAATVPTPDLAAAFRLFVWALKRQDPFEELTAKLVEAEVFWLELLNPSEEIALAAQPVEGKKDQALKTYGVALTSLQSIGRKVSAKKKSGVGKVIRVVQKIVDMILEDEKILLGLSTIRDYDDSIYTHSINVSLLAMTLGYRIGLSRKVVHRLGVCGMFYDFGKLSIPKEVLHKHGKLDPDEIAMVHMHPHVGVRQIVQLNAAREMKVYSLLSSFEHHLRYDRSGYPQTGSQGHPSMFGRILAIADVYVALTSYRPYRAYTLSPDSAIGVMMEGVGQEFDPGLLKVFVNMMGAYPIGTLLQLDSNELALVVDSPSGIASDRPRVLILQADGKGGFSKTKIVDLAERHGESGDFLRNIVSSMNAAVYGIQPMEFLF